MKFCQQNEDLRYDMKITKPNKNKAERTEKRDEPPFGNKMGK